MKGVAGIMQDDMQRKSSERSVLVVASIASFITPFMGSSVNIALPRIGQAFAMDAVLLSWVSTSYLIASAVFLLPLGRAADVLGRRRVFNAGILVFTLMCLCIPLAESIWVLLVLRVIQGIGGAMIFSTSMAILTAVTRADRRGRAIGITVAAVYGGLTLGPFIGGMLTDRFGWQSIFFLGFGLGAAVLVMALACIREDQEGTNPGRVDIPGAAIYSLGLISLMIGFSSLPSPKGLLLMGAGVAALAAFVLWEKDQAFPVLDLKMFRANRVFACSNLAAFIHYSATFSISFLVSLYLQFMKGMSPSQAGLILVTQPAVMTVLSPLTGHLSDRIEPRIMASSGMAVTAMGLAALAFLDEHAGTGRLLMCLAFIGTGFSLFSSPNTNAVMSSVSRSDYGVASGVVSTMRITGQTFSMGVVLVLFSLIIGRTTITPQVGGAFMTALRLGFLFFSAICIPGIFASLARGDVRNRVGQ
jgi:EmrB/QacA subfamily drug resistance transporter